MGRITKKVDRKILKKAGYNLEIKLSNNITIKGEPVIPKIVQKEITIGYKCDFCGKVFFGEGDEEEVDLPISWHCFEKILEDDEELLHDESPAAEYYFVCSPSCYFEKIKEQLLKKDNCFVSIDGIRIPFLQRIFEFLENISNGKEKNKN